MATNLTDKIIATQIPEEIIALIVAVGSDKTIDKNNQEVKELLPHPAVVRAVMAEAGLAAASPAQDLDQADAWIREQRDWQTRAMLVQAQLQEQFPFTKEQATKGNLPVWAVEPWATKLLYQWADGLQEAVLQAETFLLNK
jgi:hypothetical protein